ncbi:MAG: DHHA1 domain-containing protein [Chloroflexota bacterium]
MKSQFLYMHDPLMLNFDANIKSKEILGDGKYAVQLESNYFYPSSGGQAHDTGSIGAAKVIDVFKNESGDRVVQVLDRDIPLGPAAARIDANRRTRHMQHHSGQHLLSQCFHRLLGLETLAAHIGGKGPSSIDLPDSAISSSNIKKVETLANQIIFENRLIKSYFVPASEIDSVPFRRSPKVSGAVRVIEIEDFDYSACGGTHCTQTGMIGLIKILKIERQNQNLRVYFGSGEQALEVFDRYYEIVTTLANQMSIHPEDIIDAVETQAATLKSTQKSLRKYQREHLSLEAMKMAKGAAKIAGYPVVLGLFKSRTVDELRALANQFKDMSQLVSLLAAYDEGKITMLATCAEDTGLSAREILTKHLSRIGGKGGGDNQISQGGGSASKRQFESLFDDTQIIMEEMLIDAKN